jgi:hypothetical protein
LNASINPIFGRIAALQMYLVAMAWHCIPRIEFLGAFITLTIDLTKTKEYICSTKDNWPA